MRIFAQDRAFAAGFGWISAAVPKLTGASSFCGGWSGRAGMG